MYYSQQDFLELNKVTLNKKQKHAYSLLINGKNIFITGPGGVGKSAILKIFTKLYKKSRKIAITSTTGTSAILLNGTTLHSYLGLSYDVKDIKSLVDKIAHFNWLRKRWIALECLIIDEISMLDPNLFDMLEEVARIIRDNDEPFGGIQLVISGDFSQLPCIGTNNFCFQAKSWKKCIHHSIYLDEIIRQGDPVFQNCLNNIRIGNITNEVIKVLESRKGENLYNSYGIKPTRLYSKNYDVNRINNMELDELAKDDRQFYEYDMDICVDSCVNNKNIAIEKFKKSCSTPVKIQICVGAQVMLLKNLDLANGLANGSRGIIINFIDDLPLVKFLNGEEKIINFNVWEVVENGKNILRAQQIPLKVAYAVSIHKSQGCSLDYAEIDLSTIFEYGQAYVALSRVKSLSGLSIVDINYDTIRAHPTAVEYYLNLEN